MKLERINGTVYYALKDHPGDRVTVTIECDGQGAVNHADREAIEAEIVRRVNAYEGLVGLCKRAADRLDEVWDEGPYTEGWQSDELRSLCNELRVGVE